MMLTASAQNPRRRLSPLMTIEELVTAARSGSTRAAGRLLSLVESSRRDEVLAVVGHRPARVIGITGPPGAGKSTTIAVLVAAYREQGKRVAVLAVDPSSPFSGGALLGDRIRMAAHINDSDVLIRSVATRGHLGGLAEGVPAAVRVLAALSYDVVLIETVGVGQSEIEIAAVADPAVVVLNPGAGDAIQAAKAGLLEVADIVVDQQGRPRRRRSDRARSARRDQRADPQDRGLAEPGHRRTRRGHRRASACRCSRTPRGAGAGAGALAGAERAARASRISMRSRRRLPSAGSTSTPRRRPCWTTRGGGSMQQ